MQLQIQQLRCQCISESSVRDAFREPAGVYTQAHASSFHQSWYGKAAPLPCDNHIDASGNIVGAHGRRSAPGKLDEQTLIPKRSYRHWLLKRGGPVQNDERFRGYR
jgi:hypothetical protein